MPKHTNALDLRSTDDATGRMTSVRCGLVEFLRGSEAVFLDTGARLGELSRRASALVARAAGAASLSTDEGARRADERLDRELGRLERSLEGSRAEVEAELRSLASIVQRVEAVAAVRKDFEDIPRTLRLLGMNTRIENARAAARNSGMETVATEIRRLADAMESRFQALQEQATTLSETAASARATAQRFQADTGGRSAEMLQETRRAVEALRALERQERAVVSRAVAVSQAVAGDVSDVLVSLQCHDATRQMLEHVVQELEAGEDADAAGAAERCGVLAAQVRGARERLVSALGGMAAKLEGIGARVVDVGAEVSRLAAGEGEASRVAQVQAGVARAVETLHGHLAHEGETAAAVGRVGETVEGIAAHLSDIHGLGSAVKIIALNALVETGRAGADGRVLAVLAQGMGGLAAEVAQRTGEVTEALRGITADAASLSRAAAGLHGADGAAVADDLAALSVALRADHDRLRETVASLAEESGRLREELAGMARELSAQAGVAAGLERLEAELEALAGPARPGAAGSGADASRRYTMEAEREIHRRAVGGRVAARLPAPAPAMDVELF